MSWWGIALLVVWFYGGVGAKWELESWRRNNEPIPELTQYAFAVLWPVVLPAIVAHKLWCWLVRA